METVGCDDYYCRYATSARQVRGTRSGCTCDQCPYCGGTLAQRSLYFGHLKSCQRPDWAPPWHDRVDRFGWCGRV